MVFKTRWQSDRQGGKATDKVAKPPTDKVAKRPTGTLLTSTSLAPNLRTP